MKELSIEEKAKAYDNALKEAVIAHKDEDRHLKATLEKIFPELKESEDERIRKSLIILLQHFCKGYRVPGLDFPVSYKDMLAWLERQGEHANFSNKIQIGDKVTRNEDGVLVNLSQLKRVAKKDEKQDEQKSYASETMNEKWDFDSGFTRMMEKEQKHAAWSEEDEKIHRKCICAMRASACGFPEEEKFVEQVDNWLKFLKDRYTWKPSDEQMDALHYVTNFDYGGHKATLVSLYEQLKKLKG